MTLRRMLSRCSMCLPFVLSAALPFTCAISAAAQQVRFLPLANASDTVRLFKESGLPGTNIQDEASWNRWIREQDKQVRARIDRGVEDSISNLILYGTSYTNLPRLDGPEQAITASGELLSPARERIQALLSALQSARNERIRFVRDFLARQRIESQERSKFLTENLKRFAQEQRSYQAKLNEAAKSQKPDAVFEARGTLYAARGLSVDTSLLPNFGIEDTLRALVAKGVLKPRSIRRIAIIGPGLDFTDKREGYDFYPLQTTQPFAVMEAALRLGLADADKIDVTTLDLNPLVNSHIAGLVQEAQAGKPYTVQLPRDAEAGWSSSALAYWDHFGNIIGTLTEPLPMPPDLKKTLKLRAVAISTRFAARVHPFDVDIVAQTLDNMPRFDLVVATNILVYYNIFEQALAMQSIAQMMAPGGVFLANNVLPSLHTSQLAYLGRRTISYAANGAYGDDFVVYQRQ